MVLLLKLYAFSWRSLQNNKLDIADFENTKVVSSSWILSGIVFIYWANATLFPLA
jgi:hypothetical protein